MRGIQGSFHFAFCKRGHALIFCRLEERLFQPVSMLRDCSDVSFVAPVTMRAASF